jgi:DNA-binding NarL/FixJ family response regulator
MTGEIRILLVDDHSLFRESLSRLLQAESDVRIVGQSASIAEGLSILDRESADIILLDYDLGEEQGSQFLEEARRKSFAGKILMVTAGMGDADAIRALERGASGIFLKHSPPAELLQAIHRIVNGEMWLDPRAVRSVISGATGQSQRQRAFDPLNARERAVLKAVFEGLTNKEIAQRMELSESSIKAVLQQLFDKTGVRSRGQLVRIALEKHAQDWLAEPEV